MADAIPLSTFAARLAAADLPLLIDVRDAPDFAAGHVAGSGNLPAAELEPRRAELPPRDQPLLVLAGDAGDASAAAATLERMGYARVAWLDGRVAALGTASAARDRAARMWSPAPFLAEVAPEVPRGRAADLAAGSGREATYLALAGFQVEAWDAAPEALARAVALADREGARIEAVRANLEAQIPPLPESSYALLTCFRFLHRPLFPAMARALAPGGHLVYETYRIGQERFGHPRRRQFLLRDGELAASFAALGLEILRFEEPGPADGPITARLWARRP